jgi:hypothetical protein
MRIPYLTLLIVENTNINILVERSCDPSGSDGFWHSSIIYWLIRAAVYRLAGFSVIYRKPLPLSGFFWPDEML